MAQLKLMGVFHQQLSFPGLQINHMNTQGRATYILTQWIQAEAGSLPAGFILKPHLQFCQALQALDFHRAVSPGFISTDTAAGSGPEAVILSGHGWCLPFSLIFCL